MRRLLSFVFLDQASNLAPEVDFIFFALVALCGAVTFLVMAFIIFFAIRYRRGSKASRAGKKLSSRRWETTWTIIPSLIFIGIFIWAAKAYFHMLTPPAGTTETYVVAKQWMWKIQHPDGRREINELHIPVGRTVKLVMTSEDVIHDFFVPAFRTKQDVVPGRYTTIWFTPTKPGKYHLFCSQYCGTNHSTMGGWIYVMEPGEHAKWLDGQPAPDSLVAAGERAFHMRGCSGCHEQNSQIRAPLLDGIYDKPVPLSDGSMVIADDQYLRDSILLPNKQISAGYQAIMPSFHGQISEEELNAIIAYLKSLKDTNAP
ncbi:MAG: cytochrome c oxidase subunit II [Verrucomicrobiota bacterium]|nr:cytochrome c oxidase subunit II [Verrucomicrobiota bacterium]MDQ2918811.1 cytochrome c oxidase subunit II [Verrucomicrobiota bacterium]